MRTTRPEVLVLCGFPGSGKSTYCKELPNHVRINQDELGSRDACLREAAQALDAGKSVVIDRCNTTREQRRLWTRLAQDFGADTRCLYLFSDPEECMHRIHERKDHPTIKADMSFEKKREIVAAFVRTFELPSLEEGFGEIILRRNG